MSDNAFRAVVALVAAGAAVVVARISFCRAVDLPPLPPEPKKPAARSLASLAKSVASDPRAYQAELAADSRALHIDPPVTPADLSEPLPSAVSDERFALEPRGKAARFEVLGLELALAVEEIEGTPRRQMVLAIRNRTSDFLAYRVVTRPSRGTRECFDKADHAHNAVALAPGELARRSECLYERGGRLFVDRVETVTLRKLSYFYLSAVPPAALGLELRAGRGHRPPSATPSCQIFQPAALEESMRRGHTTWRDLVDFYARHSCQTFTFPIGYKAFARPGERPLPVVEVGP